MKLFLVECYNYRYMVCDTYAKALKETKRLGKAEEAEDWEDVAEITEIEVNKEIE